MLKSSIFEYHCHNSVNPHSTYLGLELIVYNGILQPFLRENLTIPRIYSHPIEASVNAPDNGEMYKELLKLEYIGTKDHSHYAHSTHPHPIFHFPSVFSLPTVLSTKYGMKLSKHCLTAWEQS